MKQELELQIEQELDELTEEDFEEICEEDYEDVEQVKTETQNEQDNLDNFTFDKLSNEISSIISDFNYLNKYNIENTIKYLRRILNNKDSQTYVCEDCGRVIDETQAKGIFGTDGEVKKVVCEDCVCDINKYAECEDCGELFEITDMVETEDGYVCKDCLQEDYEQCYECGGYYRRCDMTQDQSGEYYCNDCRDDYLHYCDRCEEWTRYDIYEVRVGRYNEYWCDDCVDRHAFYCNGYDRYYSDEECSEEVDGTIYSRDYCRDNFYYCENCDSYSDSNHCEYCDGGSNEYNYNNVVRDYHDAPNKRFIGLDLRRLKKPQYNENTKSCVGIELEVDRDRRNEDIERDTLEEICDLIDNDVNQLYFEHDGSLDYGFEIITQPHTIEAFNQIKWKEIFEVLKDNGYKSHDTSTCGLHVHISRDFFGSTQKKQDNAISKLISFFDNEYDEIIKVSRREMRQAREWADKYYTSGSQNEVAKQSKEIVKNSKHWGHSSRYRAVNLTNSQTIEFRIMRGTLKYETFMACIDFLYRIAMNSKTIKWKDLYKTDLWFKGMKKETIEYIKNRDAFKQAISYLELKENNKNNKENNESEVQE